MEIFIRIRCSPLEYARPLQDGENKAGEYLRCLMAPAIRHHDLAVLIGSVEIQ